MPKFVPYRKIKEYYDIDSQTLRAWATRGTVNYRTIQNNKRKTWLYDLESIGKALDEPDNCTTPILSRILYARVSSKKQKDDLTRQIQILQKAYPDGEIISDIGSGINDKRPGFSKLVERICRGEISQIVVTYKDRLTRFGYEFFKQVCLEHGTRILVFSKENHLQDISKGETRELQEDLLSIVNVFVARRNGRRSAQLKKIRKKQAEEDKKKET